MKTPRNITVEVLKDIRNELRETNARIDRTNQDLGARIDRTNENLGALRQESQTRFDELGRRIVESELRTATALTELAGTVREMTSVLRAQGDLRPRVEKCEQEIAEIHRRLPEAS